MKEDELCEVCGGIMNIETIKVGQVLQAFDKANTARRFVVNYKPMNSTLLVSCESTLLQPEIITARTVPLFISKADLIKARLKVLKEELDNERKN